MGVDPTGSTVAVPLAAPSLLSPGDVVAERYKVQALLGAGAMGVVYRVEHVHMHRQFALKVLGRDWADSPDAFARFEREAIAAGTISHPHVAQATDFGRSPDGSCFLILEYVDGRTLRSLLKEGPLPTGRALHITRAVVTAVGAAHAKGVIHRDLKPENIMLVEHEGDPDFVKVLDFGIAKIDRSNAATAKKAVSSALTRQGALMGTPYYMSPEQALGERVDARTDFYSVGVMLFEMLTGECPFRGEPGAVVRQHVLKDAPPLPRGLADARVEALIRRLLAKEPKARVANAAALLGEIDACSTLPAGPSPPPEPSCEPSTSPDPATTVSSHARNLTRSALALPASLVSQYRARRRRRRLRAAFAWPADLVDRYRSWRSRRRRKALLASAIARFREFRFVAALGVAVLALLLTLLWWIATSLG